VCDPDFLPPDAQPRPDAESVSDGSVTDTDAIVDAAPTDGATPDAGDALPPVPDARPPTNDANPELRDAELCSIIECDGGSTFDPSDQGGAAAGSSVFGCAQAMPNGRLPPIAFLFLSMPLVMRRLRRAGRGRGVRR
jgi:hypothetical protein